MKVLLLRDVHDLGKAGQVVTVSDGHARNFLFPRKLAQQATSDIVQQAQQKQAKEADILVRKQRAVEDVVAALNNQRYSFSVAVAKGGGVVTSIHDTDIVRAVAPLVTKTSDGILGAEDITVATKPIKALGEHQLSLKVGRGSWGREATLTIQIEADTAK